MRTSSSADQLAVVIDHNMTRLYRVDTAVDDWDASDANGDNRPGLIPHGNDYEINRQHLHQKSSHFSGQKVPEDHAYYAAVAEAMKDAKETLIISHGKGKSSAGLVLFNYLSEHHRDVLDNVVGMETIDKLTDNQLVAHARHAFTNPSHRRAVKNNLH